MVKSQVPLWKLEVFEILESWIFLSSEEVVNTIGSVLLDWSEIFRGLWSEDLIVLFYAVRIEPDFNEILL